MGTNGGDLYFDLAIAAAVHVRPGIWFGDLLSAFVCVGVVARDHHDVAVVHDSHVLALTRRAPWQQGFRAHVMVGKRAPVAMPTRSSPVSDAAGTR